MKELDCKQMVVNALLKVGSKGLPFLQKLLLLLPMENQVGRGGNDVNAAANNAQNHKNNSQDKFARTTERKKRARRPRGRGQRAQRRKASSEQANATEAIPPKAPATAKVD